MKKPVIEKDTTSKDNYIKKRKLLLINGEYDEDDEDL